MAYNPNFSGIAALIGDPTRAIMLAALFDNVRLSASELSLIAGVSNQTISWHLKKLTDEKILRVRKVGRTKLFALGDPEIAELIEKLMVVAETKHAPRNKLLRDSAFCYARRCYDHIAGDLGVKLFHRLILSHYLTPDGAGNLKLTMTGREWMAHNGLSLEETLGKKRRFAFPCMDWSAHQPHLGGALGESIYNLCMNRNHLGHPEPGQRTLRTIWPEEEFFRRLFLSKSNTGD